MSKKLTVSGIMMAVYVVMTVIFGVFSYGPIQVRFAAGLYTLAAPMPFLIVPLSLATSIANLFGGYGLPDAIGGFVATAAACYGCYLFRNRGLLVPLAIPLFSAPILAAYLHILFNLPILVTFASIFTGQLIAAYTMGLAVLKANDIYNRRNKGEAAG